MFPSRFDSFGGIVERRLLDHVVDAARQDGTEHRIEGSGSGTWRRLWARRVRERLAASIGCGREGNAADHLDPALGTQGARHAIGIMKPVSVSSQDE